MSKHLIGTDAEVYILYEDKVLLKSREKKTLTWGTIFVQFFPFMNDISVMNRPAVISSIKVSILFLIQEKK